jgi:hypothetical protein
MAQTDSRRAATVAYQRDGQAMATPTREEKIPRHGALSRATAINRQQGVWGMTMTLDALRQVRVDQVGGLRAPAPLRRLFESHDAGELSTDAFVGAREAAIAAIIAKQESLGIPVVTDGELRRRNFQDSFNAAVHGFEPPDLSEPGGNLSAQPFTRTEAVGRRRWRALDKLRLTRNIPLEEFLLSDRVASHPVKVTLLSADRIADRDVQCAASPRRDRFGRASRGFSPRDRFRVIKTKFRLRGTTAETI